MSEIVNSVLVVYAGLFPIVNPLGSAPVFLNLTRDYSPAVRHEMARRVAVNGFLMLLASLLVGSHVLEFFGITLPVVRIAGGLVVTSMGWQLLHKGDDVEQRKGTEAVSDTRYLRDAFYPLTMPLTVGPGSITVAITLGSNRPPIAAGFGKLAIAGGGAIVGLAAIAATIFVCYRFADDIGRLLGEAGTNVFLRLSAFILLCIGIEIVWSGYSSLIAPGS